MYFWAEKSARSGDSGQNYIPGWPSTIYEGQWLKY